MDKTIQKGNIFVCFRSGCFSAEYKCSNHFSFSFTVEQEKLVQMKRAKECRSDEQLGGKRSTNGSEVQTNQEEHSSVSSVPSPVRSGCSPISSVSSHGDQVQATVSSSSPSKESRYLHNTFICITIVYTYACACEF